MTERNVRVIFTGGTIEKVYDEVRGGIDNLDPRFDSFFPRIRLPYVKVHSTRLMNIDSLYMTDEHRAQICEALASHQDEGFPIIITHGTDTMVETGRYLKSHIPTPKVPVILTGAMLPLVVENSDGFQNLAESFMATRFLTPGFYIVFHNEFYDVDHVRKNREKKTFEPMD